MKFYVDEAPFIYLFMFYDNTVFYLSRCEYIFLFIERNIHKRQYFYSGDN